MQTAEKVVQGLTYYRYTVNTKSYLQIHICISAKKVHFMCFTKMTPSYHHFIFHYVTDSTINE